METDPPEDKQEDVVRPLEYGSPAAAAAKDQAAEAGKPEVMDMNDSAEVRNWSKESRRKGSFTDLSMLQMWWNSRRDMTLVTDGKMDMYVYSGKRPAIEILSI